MVAAAVLFWAIGAAILPGLIDPERNLARIAKRVCAGPKDPEDAKRIKAEFDQAIHSYLIRFGQLSASSLAQKLGKVLPHSAFEVHITDLPRNLRVVEIDTVLQATDYLVMNNGSNARVFALTGLEIFDAGRIINDSAGPLLVLLGHTAGQPPHRPQVKVLGLLPDDLTDETDKLLPPLRGEGSARFAKNGRDILLDLSLLSLGQSEKLFSTAAQAEDGTARQYLEWKDAHYVSRYDLGSSPFAALYALARCMRYPELTQTHIRFLATAGERLVANNKSPDAGSFQIKRITSNAEQNAYVVSSSVGQFEVAVKKENSQWYVASAKTITTPFDTFDHLTSSASADQSPENKINKPNKAPYISKDGMSTQKKQEEKPKSIATAQTAVTKIDNKHLPRLSDQTQIKTKSSDEDKPNIVNSTVADRHSLKQDTNKQRRTTPSERVSGNKAEISQNISAGTVNIRSAPSTDAKPVTEIGKGATLEVLDKEKGWYKVRYHGKEGFVYGGLVDYKRPDAYTTAVVTKSKTIVDSKHNPVSTPVLGDRVVIVGGLENHRYKVQLSNGKIGYLEKDAVDVSIEAPPLVP